LVENALRSADYLARRDARMADLENVLGGAVGDRACVTLEVGCGHGHFLTAYAAAHPETFCIGIDLLNDRILRAGRKRDRAKLTNLIFLQAEAGEFLRVLPPAIRFADIFILFPDPWPKRRHHKNRILQSTFLTDLAARAGESTRLCFRTDYEPYFKNAAAVVSAHDSWEFAPPESWPFERETVFQSRAPGFYSWVARARTAPVLPLPSLTRA
jgi:tRNA (guanine-N7-)-methyltransferase